MKSDARNFTELYAMYTLGMLGAPEIRQFALKNLEEPVDEDILALVICDELDEVCIIDSAREVFRKQGLLELSLEDTLRVFARYASNLIVSHELSPKDGVELIAKARQKVDLPDFHELDPFVYVFSEIDDRPEDRAFFESSVLDEASRWINRDLPSK